MPSSGKSTLGKRIAQALHYHFVDTDKLIVRDEGRSIPFIFSQFGEAYFREAERRMLRTIRPGQSFVVSTGGGMPCFHDNMAYINTIGVSVFLDVPVETLVQRITAHAQDRTGEPDRPLYNAHDPELLRKLRQRYADRIPFYSQAHIIVPGEANEEDVLSRVGEWL